VHAFSAPFAECAAWSAAIAQLVEHVIRNDGVTGSNPVCGTNLLSIKNRTQEGRFGKQDFRYLVDEDVYVCPAGERLTYSFTTKENGLVLYRYSTNACQSCAIKHSCTTGKERRITRWEHEHILEAVQRRLDEHPEKMRQRRETVEQPFGTIKARMGATHFLMKTLPPPSFLALMKS
jgi:hypothetical protein